MEILKTSITLKLMHLKSNHINCAKKLLLKDAMKVNQYRNANILLNRLTEGRHSTVSVIVSLGSSLMNGWEEISVEELVTIVHDFPKCLYRSTDHFKMNKCNYLLETYCYYKQCALIGHRVLYQ